MYESYWRLDSKPFENTPDPKFLYYSSKHEEALMRLLYATRENKQGAVLTGEYGSGKTLLSRVLLQDLHGQEHFQTVLIINPKISKMELLREMLFQLGEHDTSSLKEEIELLRLLEAKLKQNLQNKKRTVFIIDEAQVLEKEELDDLRLLLNFQNQDRFLLTLILIGQNDLKEKLQGIEPLKQRLPLRYHLEALDLKETEEYIAHRLSVVGGKKEIFSPGALSFIFEGSKGTPRRINNICDYALLIGYSNKVPSIGVNIVEECLKDLELLPPADLERVEEIEQEKSANGEDKTDGTYSRHPQENEGVEGPRERKGPATTPNQKRAPKFP